MYSKSSDRSPNGAVGVESRENRLRLHLPRYLYEGKNKYLTLGLADTPENRKLAEVKAHQIDLDIISGNFDPSLAKYDPKRQIVRIVETPKTIQLNQLWDKYVSFKSAMGISPSTIAKDYTRCANYIKKFPTKSLDDATQIRIWLLNNTTPIMTKRTLTQLMACCDWAVKSGMIKDNPFIGMAKDIVISKSQKEGGNDINCFSSKERDSVISAFKISRYYSRYAPLVEFLFFTGCRPSEAIALRWKNVNDKFILIQSAVVPSIDGLVEKLGLKSQKSRKFPINKRLKQFLESIKPENVNPDDLIFPSPKGGFIDFHNFRNRAWKTVLKGLDIEYRKPYQTRHTFITLCLDAGIDAKDVARWVGNSPEIIYQHYASNKRDLAVPEL